MNELHDRVAHLLLYIGIDKTDTSWVSRVALVLAAVIISYTCTTLFKYIIIPSVRRITSRTKATWDDYLFNAQRTPSNSAYHTISAAAFRFRRNADTAYNIT